ncbi:MAG TPA: hypothetical protein VFL28_12055, partial [bacterium]|nr:hypothetical protein [bacterium]
MVLYRIGNDITYLALGFGGSPEKQQQLKKKYLEWVRVVLQMIQKTRADMRKVAQQQTEVGRQIFHLRDMEAEHCASTPTAAQPGSPKPVGSNPPSSGRVVPYPYGCTTHDSISFTVGSRSAKSVNCGNTYLST